MEGDEGLTPLSEEQNDKIFSFAEWADDLCPYYMSIGVSCNDYWHGDYSQLGYYVEAHKLKQERENYTAWLQGAYVYDAIGAMSPILQAFAKKGTKPTPYHKEPYGAKHVDKVDDKPKQDIQALNLAAKFSAFTTRFNQKFEKEGIANGTDN